MGTAEFGIPTLKVLNDNYNLDAIITNYDKPSGRGLKIKFSPVKKFAINNNISFVLVLCTCYARYDDLGGLCSSMILYYVMK